VLSTNKTQAVSENRFLISVKGMAVGQQFFITDKGYMGMGNPQVGDKVFVLIGSDVPFVLRSSDQDEACFFYCWRLLCAWDHGRGASEPRATPSYPAMSSINQICVILSFHKDRESIKHDGIP
jgi:hypothetical protein